MDNEYLLQPFMKTVSINDLPEGAWTYITGQSEENTLLEKYYRAVPWLFRGVDIRANAVANMPFGIFRGTEEVDSNEDYQNVVKILPNPEALFGLIEAALTIWNYAYLYKRQNVFSIVKGLRYFLPSSITESYDEATGDVTFTRYEQGKPVEYTPKELIYFWGRDPYTEYGRPKASPAQAAAAASGILFNADEFAWAFFKRGAIKATIFTTTTNVPPQERSRLKAFIDRFFGQGTKTAWNTEILNADAVTPIVVGEGLESLAERDLTELQREAIATGLAIPHTLLFSSSASGLGGGGVAEQDKLNLYDQHTVPQCKFIANVLNSQIFEPMGYRLKFKPETLDVYQEDEEQRAAAMSAFADALQKLESKEAAYATFAIFGLEIPDEAQKLLDQHYANKEQKAEEAQTRMDQAAQNPPEQPPPSQNGNQPGATIAPVRNASDFREIDLDKWRRKALKRLERGVDAACPFESEHIAPALAGAISGALETAKSVEDVEQVFASLEWVGYP